MYLFSFSTATPVTVQYTSIDSSVNTAFFQWSQIITISGNFLQQKNLFYKRYKAYEHENRILGRKVNTISQGNSEHAAGTHKMSHRMNQHDSSIVWILLCIQAYTLPKTGFLGLFPQPLRQCENCHNL